MQINGNGTKSGMYIKGLRFNESYVFAASGVAKPFFVAPVACKVISASENHITAAGQAGTIQVEKVPSGTAAGSGTVVLAATFDAAGTANTTQTKAALTTTAANMAAGDRLCLKTASGALTSLADAVITVTFEVL